MSDQQFDELARRLAQPMSRRRAFKALAGAIVGGILLKGGAGEAFAKDGGGNGGDNNGNNGNNNNGGDEGGAHGGQCRPNVGDRCTHGGGHPCCAPLVCTPQHGNNGDGTCQCPASLTPSGTTCVCPKTGKAPCSFTAAGAPVCCGAGESCVNKTCVCGTTTGTGGAACPSGSVCDNSTCFGTCTNPDPSNHTQPACGAAGSSCVCVTDTSGNAVCVQKRAACPTGIGTDQYCTSNAQCPGGSACIPNPYCGGKGVCNAPCGSCPSGMVLCNGLCQQCCTAATCPQSTNQCQKAICTGGVCGLAPIPGCCTSDAQCDDGNPCTADSCDATSHTCVHTLTSGGSCSTGNLCSVGDTCQNGKCVSGGTKTCTASDQCHVAGTCDPATGACSNPPAANGTACNAGTCTTGDTCRGGVCMSGPASYCPGCGMCNADGTCTPQPAGTQCSAPSCSNGTLTNASTCDGSSTTCPPPTTTSCAPYTCSTAGTACATSCVTDAGCATGFSCCGNICTDLQTDSNNCGKCGVGCGPGTTCKGGACVSVCPSGATYCRGTAANPVCCPPDQYCDTTATPPTCLCTSSKAAPCSDGQCCPYPGTCPNGGPCVCPRGVAVCGAGPTRDCCRANELCSGSPGSQSCICNQTIPGNGGVCPVGSNASPECCPLGTSCRGPLPQSGSPACLCLKPAGSQPAVAPCSVSSGVATCCGGSTPLCSSGACVSSCPTDSHLACPPYDPVYPSQSNCCPPGATACDPATGGCLCPGPVQGSSPIPPCVDSTGHAVCCDASRIFCWNGACVASCPGGTVECDTTCCPSGTQCAGAPGSRYCVCDTANGGLPSQPCGIDASGNAICCGTPANPGTVCSNGRCISG